MIIAENITKIYVSPQAPTVALNNVSFRIKEGEVCCIMGKSGSGKSTLLRQLSLLDAPSRGRVYIDRQDTSQLSDRERSYLRLIQFGYVFQEYALLPELNAIENVLLPQLQLLKGQAGNTKRRAHDLLDLVGLHGMQNKPVRELSGGEKQRVAIARALVNEPKIIFADEPTASLDTMSSLVVMHVLTKLNKERGTTIVFVSHDPDHHSYADKLLTLKDGALTEAYV